MKIDIEYYLDQVESFVKANLNNKLSEIDTEKNDGITLKPINDKAVVFQTLNAFPVNFDPVLFYGIDSVQGESIESANEETYQIEISIILADKADKATEKKLLRYHRALKEIFQENYFKIGNTREKVRVTSLSPISFTLQNTTNPFRAIGVRIEVSLF